VECSSAAIQALASFRKLYPGHRREEIQRCIDKATAFIEKIQGSDGSWYAPSIWEFSIAIVYNGEVCFWDIHTLIFGLLFFPVCFYFCMDLNFLC